MSRYPGRILSSTAPTVSANSAKGIWTLDEAMRYIRAGQWPVPTGNGDPYFQYNTMLLPGQGTTGAQNNTFQDSSSNNFTVNRSGNVPQGTFTPFSGTAGNWSNFFDGSNDQLTVPSNAALGMSTGDFTIELWYYQLSRGSGNTLLAPSTDNLNIYITTAGLLGYYNGSTQDTALTVPLNQWGHIAVVRSSGTLKIYYNGAQVLSQANSINYGTASWYIGTNPAGIGASNGFMSNVRVVKGVAVYTGDFTPPTAPLAATQSSGTNISAITGTQTSLLTCQNNRFVDNSTNAFAITANNGVAVTPFQPFGAPTVAYSASTIGGSGYFDGTGDFLSVLNNAAFNFGSGAFTIEFWYYPTTLSGTQCLITNYGGSTTGFVIQMGGSTAGSGRIDAGFSGDGADITSTNAVQLNSWNHIAISGTPGATGIKLFINGAQEGSTYTGATSLDTSSTLLIGEVASTNRLSGYLSGLRLLKGTAQYTTTFTPPTAPLTAITNTSLLCNFTNAGIIDNAQDNNLETVGGAQISTTQYKWGASSMYFDGTGDYLIPSSSTTNLQAFGTGDFTIEFWFYSNNSGSQQMLYDSRPASTNGNYITLYKSSSNVLELYVNSATRITGTATIAANTWYHVALSRTGGGTKLYVNGNQTGSTYADTTNYLNASNRPVIAADGATLGNIPLNGYIQDLRITKGYARYPYNFTAPTAALPLFWQAAATPSSDPYFENTTLLLPGNGTNGAQNNTFLDSSTNAFTITRNGNTTQGTFTPFSQTGWGNYFDGTSVLFNTSTASSALNLSTGSFTIEAWVYLPSVASYQYVLQLANTAGNTSGLVFGINSSGQPYIGNGVVLGNSGSYALVANTWNHLAVVSNGTTIQFYTNGVANGSSQSFNPNAAQYFYVGRDASGSNALTGYISNLRVTKGAALYTSNFIPSTTPLTTTVSSGTVSLLTCQSNRFVDNSANTFAISTSGSPSVQAFSPFNPTAAYSTSTVGGSGYFDGTGDYLSSTFTATTIFSGNATFEGWVYFNTVSGQQVIYRENTSGTGFNFGSNGTALQIDDTVNGGSVFATSSGVIKANEWNYIAVTRSSNTFTIYVNGTSVGTNSSVYTFFTGNTSGFLMGSVNGSSNMLNGYICSARVSNTARTITVPTAPYTSDANTKILLNYTNGGIIDNTAKNNLETVGGASISTTLSKFGGSSMYFDGTGDQLVMPASQNFEFGSGDFTVECWVYITGTSGSIINYSNGQSANSNFCWEIYQSSSTVVQTTMVEGSTVYTASSSSFSLNAWNHVAAVRYGNTLRIYINGIVGGTTATVTGVSVSVRSGTTVKVSGYNNATGMITGYINDLRLTKGIGRYTSNFTPPATAFLTL